MNEEQADVLNVTQQVLRHLVISLLAATGGDPKALSGLLLSASADPALEPIARRMLGDLADGVNMLARMGAAPPH